jgi:hypothetical protein
MSGNDPSALLLEHHLKALRRKAVKKYSGWRSEAAYFVGFPVCCRRYSLGLRPVISWKRRLKLDRLSKPLS